MAEFVHLRLHTEYSLIDSVVRVPELVDATAAEGDIGRALVNAREREADRALDQWLELFGNRFYIELQRVGRPEEEAYLAASVALASRRGVPVVATTDVRFLKGDDFESHEARV